jgi:hypothetical protein
MSRVLFLCLIPKIPLDESEELSIIELVESYGRLSKVLPIAHSFPFKALLEVTDMKSHASILKHLSFLNHPLGQLKVFPSKKREINNFTASPHKCPASYGSPLSTRLNYRSTEEPEHGDDSWCDVDNNLAFEISATEIHCPKKSANLSDNEHDQCRFSDASPMRPESGSINSSSSVTNSNWIQIKYESPNMFLLKALSNLLGCFGNLRQLRYSPSSALILAEFESPSQAKVTASTLNNVPFFAATLRLSQISLVDVTSALVHFETFHEDYRKHRFTHHLNIRMNPLSSNLHFTNLPRELDPVIFYSLLSQVNEPLMITRSTSKTTPDSFMYLVKFQDSTQAAEVLSVLHNKVIQGKSVKVSFSHYHRNAVSRKHAAMNQCK